MGFFTSEKIMPQGVPTASTNYFNGLLQQPNMGYDKRRSETLDPTYNRALDRTRQAVAQQYANMGWGIKKVGPQAAAMSRNITDLNASRAQTEFNDQNQWAGLVANGAREQVATPQTQPSAFASFAGPLMMGTGLKYGGDIMKGAYDVGKQGLGTLYDYGKSAFGDLFSSSSPIDYSMGGLDAAGALSNNISAFSNLSTTPLNIYDTFTWGGMI